MSNNINLERAPFLRTQRAFPRDDVNALSGQVDQMYIDIAGKINEKVIGIYGYNFQAVTGERWSISGGNYQQNTRQPVRQVYPVTGAGNIPHGINLATIGGFTREYGTFTDGTSWYSLGFVGTTPPPTCVTFYVDPTNIVIVADAGAPSIVSGWIVLEWFGQALST